MKQTAVEWLNEQMNNIKSSSTKMYGTVQFLEKELTKLLEQAKEMEKEQIIQARTTAPIIPTIDMIDYVKESEQYYKETFKSE